MKEDFIIIFLTLSRSYPPFLSLATLSSAPAVSFFPWPSVRFEVTLALVFLSVYHTTRAR